MLINAADPNRRLPIETMAVSEVRDIALENLFSKICLFGLQEYFAESLVLFSTSFNWTVPLFTSLNKKEPSRLLEFKKHHLDRIEELNVVDIEIYKAAKKKFLKIIPTENNRLKDVQIYLQPHEGRIPNKSYILQNEISPNRSELVDQLSNTAKNIRDRSSGKKFFDSRTRARPEDIRSRSCSKAIINSSARGRFENL